jgi:hypothetical protein
MLRIVQRGACASRAATSAVRPTLAIAAQRIGLTAVRTLTSRSIGVKQPTRSEEYFILFRMIM